MSRTAVWIGGAVAALTAAGSASAGLVIDDYGAPLDGVGTVELSAASAGDVAMATDAGISLAGTTGTRTTTVELTSVAATIGLGDLDAAGGFAPSGFLVDGEFNAPAGPYMTINSGLGTTGFVVAFEYTLPGVNLLSAGDQFEFVLASMDFDEDNRPGNSAPLLFEIDVTGGGADSASVSITEEGFYTIDFASYTGVDFSNVTSLTVRLSASVLTPDLSFGPVSVIPSPGAAGVLALAGMAAARRRRG